MTFHPVSQELYPGDRYWVPLRIKDHLPNSLETHLGIRGRLHKTDCLDRMPIGRKGSGNAMRAIRYPTPGLDKFEFLARNLHDGQNRYTLTFDGRLDQDRIARAIRLSLDAEPILGCRFVWHPWWPYWERSLDLDTVPLCPVVEVQDLESELGEFLASPLDSLKGIQVRARLFRGSQDVLCIKLTHESADAAGAFDYLALIGKIYRELGTNPAYSPPVNLGRRGQGQVFRNVGFLPLLRACFHFSFPRSHWRFPQSGQRPTGGRFALRRIGPEGRVRMKNYCRDHQVSVNDLMTAAYFRALCELLDPPPDIPLPIEVSVDLRRHLPLRRAEAICNLSGAFFPALRRKAKDTLEDTVAEVHRMTEASQSTSPWLRDVLLLEGAPFSLLRQVAPRLISRQLASGRIIPWLTNVGIIDRRLPDFGDIDLKNASGFGPVPNPPGCFLLTWIFSGNLIISTSFTQDSASPYTGEHLLDAFVRQLSLAGAPQALRTSLVGL